MRELTAAVSASWLLLWVIRTDAKGTSTGLQTELYPSVLPGSHQDWLYDVLWPMKYGELSSTRRAYLCLCFSLPSGRKPAMSQQGLLSVLSQWPWQSRATGDPWGIRNVRKKEPLLYVTVSGRVCYHGIIWPKITDTEVTARVALGDMLLLVEAMNLRETCC